jgi:hypothetical protein
LKDRDPPTTLLQLVPYRTFIAPTEPHGVLYGRGEKGLSEFVTPRIVLYSLSSLLKSAISGRYVSTERNAKRKRSSTPPLAPNKGPVSQKLARQHASSVSGLVGRRGAWISRDHAVQSNGPACRLLTPLARPRYRRHELGRSSPRPAAPQQHSVQPPNSMWRPSPPCLLMGAARPVQQQHHIQL